MNKDEINAKYLALHDALGKQVDAPDKGLFDIAHRQNWYECDVELKARRVELEAKGSLTAKEQKELSELVYAT